MNSYTIKKGNNGALLLMDENSRPVALRSLLDQTVPRKVFAFDGPMGAGKTTFIKQLCEELGTEDIVNSPTFAIVNVYDTKEGEVYHFDCYRLKDIREAVDFGAEEYFYSGNYCFIEWPDIIEPLLPEDVVRIQIRVLDNGDRQLTMTY